MALETSQSLLDRIVAAFADVDGVRAVALGGSRGRGSHHAGSDYDIGLYYRGTLDLEAVERAAQALNDPGVSRDYAGRSGGPLTTPVGGWGPWVNGGGWLTIGGEPVDILYRDLDRVDQVIDEACAGKFSCTYHAGHPHAFVSTIYAGEVALGRALHDPNGEFAAAKAMLSPYPETLRAAAVARFADEARFFLAVAQKAAGKGDVVYVSGCAFRAASCLLQVVFARNGEWLINEKGAVALADKFAIKPKDLRLELEGAFAELASGPQGLLSCLRAIGALIDEAVP
ncbi:MAG: nucleotidyltransferase domain-containing protein [Proteobacteria bacterium]|nr:nucleotidyltransferase domain-containing protein [Pseudomonadota bacterium]